MDRIQNVGLVDERRCGTGLPSSSSRSRCSLKTRSTLLDVPVEIPEEERATVDDLSDCEAVLPRNESLFVEHGRSARGAGQDVASANGESEMKTGLDGSSKT